MEYMYAILLLYEAKKEITKESLTAILQAANVSIDANTLEVVLESLQTMNIADILKSFALPPLIPSEPQAMKDEIKQEPPKPAEEVGLAKLFG